MKDKLNIIFMGSGLYGSLVLNSLDQSNFNILSIFTKSNKAISRNLKKERFFDLESDNIPIRQISKFSEQDLDIIIKSEADLIIVASFGLILPDSMLSIPNFGVINIHPSLLPKYRGPSPISSCIVSGEKITGVTIMKMVKELDAGPILHQEKFELDANLTSDEVGTKLFEIGTNKINELFSKIAIPEIIELEQDHSKATFTRIVKKIDGQINWKEDIQLIYRKFKAYYSWPGIYTYWNNKRIIFKEFTIEAENEFNNEAGKILELKNDKLIVSAQGGKICVSDIQMEGGKSMRASIFVNGRPKIIGDFFNQI
ncbi:MAG: methionyl-tRNA formyltransferase [Dehalococcoidia bacterium]